MATLTVRDDGIGFVAPAEDKRRRLGLVRWLIERTGGTVTVVSKGGTVWTIGFPEASAF